jgi:hypothetical protein
MGDFRLYLFDGEARTAGRVTRPMRLAEEREEAAMALAQQLRDGAYAELWRGEDLVRIFDPD